MKRLALSDDTKTVHLVEGDEAISPRNQVFEVRTVGRGRLPLESLLQRAFQAGWDEGRSDMGDRLLDQLGVQR